MKIHYMIDCPKCGKQELSKQEYSRQLMQADLLWKCPVCHEDADWDDTYYKCPICHEYVPEGYEECKNNHPMV